MKVLLNGFAALSVLLFLAACGGSPDVVSGENETIPTPTEGKTTLIQPGPNATTDALNAFIAAKPGDTIEFDEGFFDLETTLLLQSTENIRIKGQGINDTVLSFENSDGAEGILAINVKGLFISELTVIDPPGDAIKLKGVDHADMRKVRTMWSSAQEQVTAQNWEDIFTPLTRDEFDPQNDDGDNGEDYSYTDLQGNAKDFYKDYYIVPCTQPPENEQVNQAPREYNPSGDAGRYGIYPVQSSNIYLDEVISVGASDAGIYVGQTNKAIIKNSRAVYNVMGYEIENTGGGEYENNLADCNVGGYLIYDLEGLTQYGAHSRMHGNLSIRNNTYNYTHLGGFIAAVPRGTGAVMLGYDDIEIYNNRFDDHHTAALIIVSYELLGGQNDKRLDGYVEGLHVHDNEYFRSGYMPPEPNMQRVANGDPATVLPMMVAAKNGGQGAHILWDGWYEVDDAIPRTDNEAERSTAEPYCDTIPQDKDGNDVPLDADGKPIMISEYPNPECVYNAYKFDSDGNGGYQRKAPRWFMCIQEDDANFSKEPNSYVYANFDGTTGLELITGSQDAAGAQTALASLTNNPNIQATRDLSELDCKARFGVVPESLPPIQLDTYTPPPAGDSGPTQAEIDALCNQSVTAGSVNWDAAAVDCPSLDQYQLFADAEDPRSKPNGGDRAQPFVLNTKLYSDYAVKYRVAYVPPGNTAVYRGIDDGVNQSIEFPVGTILAKTFAFRDDDAGTEAVIETRLLIKRANEDGSVFWRGLPYIWADEDGKPVARLALGGGTADVQWKYTDTEMQTELASGKELSGSTSYSIPHVNQCVTCHGNDDVEVGAAPIGPKPRHLNRGYKPESDFTASMFGGEGQAGITQDSQLQAWANAGILTGLPANAEVQPDGRLSNVPYTPRSHVPGDADEADGAADLEARARAYLEVNCQHCHNVKGLASNTGFYLDINRTVDGSYGICKTPTAAGAGTGGRKVDIAPGHADKSIISFRMAADPSSDKYAEERMPPLARSLHHAEGVELVSKWIDEVVNKDYPDAGGDSDAQPCAGQNID